MGAAACGGKGSKGRAAVNGDWPIGATSCKPKHTKVSCQPPPPPPKCTPSPRNMKFDE